MRLTIAYSKMKKRNLMLVNNATYQRETLSELPIRQPLTLLCTRLHEAEGECKNFKFFVIDMPYILQ